MSSERSPETLLLFDGNNLVYRSFFALPPLATRSGLPTNAVLGFANVLRKVLAESPPDFAAVTFDAGGKTVRHERFDKYKANRPPTPPDLKQQLPFARKLCEALGLAILEREGIEADDIIGTLSSLAERAGYRVLIVSSDKDLLQLVSNDTLVVHPVKYERLDTEGVRRKFGVAPQQIPDVLALVGDSVDNIPGVPGIGDKGAARLISEWGSLEALLEHAHEVKNKRQREALLAHRDGAKLSKELVTILNDVELDIDLERLRYKGADRESARRLFEELEFTSHQKDYLPEETIDLSARFRALRSQDELGRFLARARKTGTLAIWLDLDRTEHFDPWGARVLRGGLAVEAGEGVHLDCGRGGIAETDFLRSLQSVVGDDAVRLVAHDLKSLVNLFRSRGIEVGENLFDTRVAAYVSNPTRRSQDLPDLLLEFLKIPLSSESDHEGPQGTLPGMSGGEEASGRLAAEKAERTLRLADRLERRIVEDDLGRVLTEIELPLISVLSAMELTGIAIDLEEFQTMSKELASELASITDEIHRLAGVEFNINSPRQLAEILFEKMNLPSFKKTQKQRVASTRVDVLEELAASFPLPRKILDYRALQKLKGTYVDALPSLVHPQTGRIHTSFNQTVTATGRLSSSDPNLQNIPIRAALGRRLRRAFVAERGYRLLSADYSQIELRVLAHLSRDEALIEAFRSGEDIHERTARQVFGDAASLSEGEKRRRAKIINFSIIYGKTAFTLGKEFGVSTREAQAFIDAYLDRYPRVRNLIDEIVRETRRTGKVRTLFGRQRYVPEIGSRNRSTRAAAERVAVNTPVQGTAADLIKKAMIDLHRRLRNERMGARLLLQVHDELVLEVPEGELEVTTELVRDTMENVYPLEVPLRVDVKTGAAWEH
ncbi:MAG TPA: DNA polymerase I [Vicinamibacteria bacterium]|nr:DNA polymerase I [Vicinamibacteria bacterium]